MISGTDQKNCIMYNDGIASLSGLPGIPVLKVENSSPLATKFPKIYSRYLK